MRMTLVHHLVVLGHLWILIALVHSAAVPTQDTMVVSKLEETTNSVLSDPTPISALNTEPITEEHTPPIKLLEMDIKSTISMRYAHTAVVAHIRNPAKRAQEANFRVLLPETAFISGFVMTIGEKSYKAYVKEKEEAKQIYQDAVSQGFGAAHIAAKARDSNHFTVTVNVEPASTATFNLTYEELLMRRIDVYNHAITCQPGSLVPKFTVTVNIKESANITELRVPEIRSGNEIDATKNDPQMSNVIIQKNGASAVIVFSPDLEEQERLMHVYAEKSKQSATGQSNGEGVLGQFVVQYDVDRSKDGEILVNDGYFVHFFAPNLPPLNKYVVFVLDTSGSMMGRKIDQLKQAMQTILSELNPGDFFSIVDFDSTVSVHDLSEVDKEPPKRHYYYNEVQQELNLVEPYQATSENIEKARIIISRLQAYGVTNIDSALNVAINLVNKNARNSQQNDNRRSSTPTPPPLSTPTSEDTTIEQKSVLTEKKGGAANLEPIIIFLTDGIPVVGETNPTTIIKHFTEKNYGENRATMFSLGFGDSANHNFLRKLSLRNEGFSRHIYEAADAALQLHDFYRQVSSPLLAHVKFIYAPDQVDEETTTKHKFRSFFAGSELVVAGRVTNTAVELESQVLGFCGVLDDGYSRKIFDKKMKIPIPVEKNENFPLERLWAYLTIKQLLDERDASDTPDQDKNKENSPEKKALRLALKYEFVTPLTSLVVVKPNETNTVNAESVDKQPSNRFAVPAHSYPSSISQSGGYSASHRFAVPAHSYPSSISHSGGYSASHGLPVHRYSYPSNISHSGGYSASHGFPVYRYSYPSNISHSGGYSASHGFPVHRYSYPSNISHSGGYSVFHQSPPFIQPLNLMPSTTPVILPPGLHTYHLEDFSWTTSLLNFLTDTIVLQTNETVTLNLTRDTQAPKAIAGDANCTNAVAGGDGLCVYLTRCYEARNITVDAYKTNYCVVDGGYVGVCCHKTKIDLITVP